MTKKVLITGAGGFIGSQLARRLMNKGIDVLGIDNLTNHLYDPQLKVDRISEFKLNVKVFDLNDSQALENILQEFTPDQIIHLAAHAGVRDSFGQEEKYHKNNISGSQSLIDACRKLENPPKIIYASTSSVYGGTKELPWVEDKVDGHQLNAYAYTKYTNECQFRVSGLHNIGLRFFTVYGPWGRPDMALFGFTKNILDEKEINVYNSGNMVRDFTYIEDILDGIELVMNSEIESNEIFNIGRGKQVQLMDFIRLIEENCGKKAKMNMAPRHPADTLETWSDTSKLQSLGYNPKFDIETGVKNFVSWYKWYNGVNV